MERFDERGHRDRDASLALGSQALITARLTGDVTEGRRALAEISPSFTRDGHHLRTRVGGGDEIFRQAATQARTDFVRAEAIILPLVLGLLVALRRGVVGAATTLVMGVFSVVTTLALLGVLTRWIDISTFAANLVLVMGIGLGVDYSLLVIDRFQEERSRGLSPQQAAAGLRAGVGRTVVFSGLIVAISLLGLLLFPFPFLQSFAYAGVGTVVTSMAAALFLLPAALMSLGRRIPVPRPSSATGFWHRAAVLMMRRPARFALPVLALLLLLASPVLGLRPGLPDARVLPEEVSSRQVQDQIMANFEQESIDSLFVLPEQPFEEGVAEAYVVALSEVPCVGLPTGASGRSAGIHRRRHPGGHLPHPHVLHRLRDVDGLRGLPRGANPGGMATHPGPGGQYRDRIGTQRSRRDLGRAGVGTVLRRLRHVVGDVPQDARGRGGDHHRPRCHPHPHRAGAHPHEAGRVPELVGPGLAHEAFRQNGFWFRQAVMSLPRNTRVQIPVVMGRALRTVRKITELKVRPN